MLGVRREGRELALKLLYREEVTGLVDDAIPGIEGVHEEARAFAEELTAGVRTERGSIDRAISDASEHWEISRMGAVDRSILRIGVYELLYKPDVPVGAIINEAVDGARKYSSQECGRFVNGVLDRIARERKDHGASAAHASEPGAAGVDELGDECATGS
ncbi:MAG: transcription antitermination factor NusB [Candidatus Eisenbacteria bacterium]|nr:transcription antitermination factor NusB [Candidatus Eisenbacteria bacterium]